MANEVFRKIKEQQVQVDIALDTVEDLNKALKQVGEDRPEIDAKVRELRKKNLKWKSVLEERGL